MDWTTLSASLVGTTAIVAVLGRLLQKSFDRVLDAKLKQIEERNKAEIIEETRRKAAHFDRQLGPLKAATTLVYRARNAAREVADAPEELGHHDQRERLNKFRTYHNAIEELLFEERATLSPNVFRVLHEMKTSCCGFMESVEGYRHARRQKNEKFINRANEDIKRFYGKLDELYLLLVACVQEQISGSGQDPSKPGDTADGMGGYVN